MEAKDWILLFVPIVVNGFIIYIFQKIVSTKFERLNKKQGLRDEAILLFWRKLQNLNTVFIQANVSANESPNNLNTGLMEMRNNMLDIIEYYDTNIYDLGDFKDEYNCLNTSWNDFATVLQSFQNIAPTQQNQRTLGEKLQIVKENNLKLISSVRKRY